MNRRNSGVLIAVGAIFLAAVVTVTTVANASRNSAGTMSAANGPYITGTQINSAQVNARLADIESELTNSLDRNGRGGMLAALRGVDGTVAAPSVSWTSETGTGLYRIGASDIGFAVAGSKVFEFTASGVTIPSGKTLTYPAASVTALTLETNLAAGSGLGYWKDAVGMVHLKGTITNNTGGNATVLVATTPIAAGSRPLFARSFTVPSTSASAFYVVLVGSGGTVTASATGPAFPSAGTLAVDGIHYLAEQ